MNIIELARDVDEYVRNHHENDAWDAADPMAVHFAQAVVRSAKLADELEREGEAIRFSRNSHEQVAGVNLIRTSARIRAALEGGEL